MRTMEASGEITERDYLHAQWLHIKPRRGFQIAGLVMLTLFLLGAVAATAAALVQANLMRVAPMWAAILALAGLTARRRHVWRRLYRRQRSLQGTQSYTFSPGGLAAASTHGSGQLSWTVFLKWREDAHIFLLYPADNLFYMVPKRWFADHERISEFRALLTDQIGPGGIAAGRSTEMP